jgi:hypothetical protein
MFIAQSFSFDALLSAKLKNLSSAYFRLGCEQIACKLHFAHYKGAMTTAILTEIELRAMRIPIDMTTLCKQAGVAHSTITRWRGGAKPRAATLQTLYDELAKIEAS